MKKSCKNKDSIVVLMHDTSDVSRSYLALKDSICFLKEQGYSFKTFEINFISFSCSISVKSFIK